MENRKRHLYYDQQQPAEEPLEPGSAKITQKVFSRQPPTAEDEYFREEEEQRLHPPALGEPERVRPAPPFVERPPGFWRRLYRAIARRFDSEDWRP
jgi:hypothetical protein